MVPVSFVPFEFAGEEWWLSAARALYWPRERALVVADLHLEKASFYAAGGQMLPPYDSRETLERLARAIGETGARRVFCLGDNFHDGDGPGRLEPHAAELLGGLARAVDWVWITGNHDPALDGAVSGGLIPGMVMDEMEVGGVALRHRARAGAAGPELSGHFHPRLIVNARGRRISRPCAVASERRMILPAFGALTGGMDAADPAILAALRPAAYIRAMAVAGVSLVTYPLRPALA